MNLGRFICRAGRVTAVGAPGRPMAYLGYPGDSPLLGSVDARRGILVARGSAPQNYSHNVFCHNRTAQVLLERAGPGRVTLRNNILFPAEGEAYGAFEDGGSDPGSFLADHNLYFNGGPAPAWDVSPVQGDPLFTDPLTFDFTLRPGSPAIDSGVNTALPFDHVGVPRPQGAAYDIGAFEFRPDP